MSHTWGWSCLDLTSFLKLYLNLHRSAGKKIVKGHASFMSHVPVDRNDWFRNTILEHMFTHNKRKLPILVVLDVIVVAIVAPTIENVIAQFIFPMGTFVTLWPNDLCASWWLASKLRT